METYDVMKAIEEKTRRLYALGCLNCAVTPTMKIEVRFDIEGNVAGQARSNGIVRYNLYMAEHNFEAFITDVVPHEIGHMVAYELQRKTGRRIQPHGETWKSIVRSLGSNPSRTHKFESNPTTKVGRYAYECQACGMIHYVTFAKHEKIQASCGKARCSCKGKGQVNFLGKVTSKKA